MANKIGTSGNDTILGTNAADQIDGRGGNDILRGLFGNDLLTGGIGNDRLEGGAGADVMLGGLGNDVAFGGTGNDELQGGGGNDELHGGIGNDSLFGGGGADAFHFEVNSGRDEIYDFQNNLDTIYIDRDLGFDTVQEVLDYCSSSGGDSAIDLSKVGDDGHRIIIYGLDNFNKLADDIVLI